MTARYNQNTNISNPIGEITKEGLGEDIKRRTSGTKPKTTRPKSNQSQFPLEAFPPFFQKFIPEAQESLGMPPDYLAPAILCAASAAIGRTRAFEIKRGTVQYGNLYFAAIGNPNSNKSAPMKFAFSPVEQRDNENYQQFRRELANHTDESEEPKPTWKRSLVNDITVEALGVVHLDNPRGVTAFRDEISGFIESFNRYNKGGDQEKFLEWWSYAPMKVDRLSREPVYIPSPYISVCGTIQPGVLEKMTKGDGDKNGFIDRFLFTWPQGIKKPTWTDSEFPESLLNQYREGIENLLNLEMEEQEGRISKKPLKLRPTLEAKKRLFEFYNGVNNKLCNTAENDQLAGIHGKFDTHTARLALLLQMLWFAFEGKRHDVIELDTIERAILTAEYFREQSMKVYDRINRQTPVDRLPADKQAVYLALPENKPFKTGQAVEIAKKKGMAERTFRGWLNDKTFFEKISYGVYAKIY
ncbi:MAG: YfjI family protein [bacterium]|nr:YfjI family protein [bacterium]